MSNFLPGYLKLQINQHNTINSCSCIDYTAFKSTKNPFFCQIKSAKKPNISALGLKSGNRGRALFQRAQQVRLKAKSWKYIGIHIDREALEIPWILPWLDSHRPSTSAAVRFTISVNARRWTTVPRNFLDTQPGAGSSLSSRRSIKRCKLARTYSDVFTGLNSWRLDNFFGNPRVTVQLPLGVRDIFSRVQASVECGLFARLFSARFLNWRGSSRREIWEYPTGEYWI